MQPRSSTTHTGPATRTASPAPSAVSAMVTALGAVVGPEHLETDLRALRAAATATFATRQGVAAIARPADRAEVQACVRLANRHRVPLYPISRGRNWGYGSRVPTIDGAVILSLERLDAITDLDERLGLV